MKAIQENPLTVAMDMNDNNVAFYRKIKIDKFREIAELLGFHTGIDIDVLLPYIRHSKVLVELGVGFGRVIKALLDRGFDGKIIGIERSPELLQFLFSFSNRIFGISMSVKMLMRSFICGRVFWNFPYTNSTKRFAILAKNSILKAFWFWKFLVKSNTWAFP